MYKTPCNVRPFEKGDYVQVQTGVHAGKEGEVEQRRPKLDDKGRPHYGDELVILVESPSWGDYEGTIKLPVVVDPLKCKLHPRPGQ